MFRVHVDATGTPLTLGERLRDVLGCADHVHDRDARLVELLNRPDRGDWRADGSESALHWRSSVCGTRLTSHGADKERSALSDNDLYAQLVLSLGFSSL